MEIVEPFVIYIPYTPVTNEHFTEEDMDIEAFSS
jgi:hypothetical protein